MPSSVSRSNWRDEAQGDALAIAEASSRHIRICAGPGTGKSFAMRCRIARLLEENVDPSTVLAVTFTRPAARDLRHELDKVEVEGADEIRASTLHSYCHSILSDDQVLQATGRHPRIMLRFEERFMLHDLKQDGRSYADCERFLHAFQASWARNQDDAPGTPRTAADRTFQSDMLAWLKFHRAMQVGELVTETLKYLSANPAAEHRQLFRHILVDEYQDLNRANQDLIDLLASHPETCVMIVGDEDQSIYSMLQHAQPEGIRFYPDNHPGTTDFDLNECRRCPEIVVKVANELIRHNTNREDRELVPIPKNGSGTLEIIQFQSIEEEARGVARLVSDYLEQPGRDPGDVMILTPRRIASYQLRDALRRSGINVYSYFFDAALGTERAQERFSLLGLIADPRDRVALRCWLGVGTSNLAVDSYRRLRKYCYENSAAPADVLQQIADGATRVPGTVPIVRRFRALVEEQDRITALIGDDLVDALFPEADPDLSEIRLAAQLVLAEVSPTVDATELYRELRTRILFPEPPPSEGAVRLMSLHVSKGLSAKFVIVTSCIESWIPTRRLELADAEADRELEEQRRLFYVALTRARERLVLTSFRRIGYREAKRMGVNSTRRVGGGLEVIASRFLGELGPDAPAARTP